MFKATNITTIYVGPIGSLVPTLLESIYKIYNIMLIVVVRLEDWKSVSLHTSIAVATYHVCNVCYLLADS